MAVVDKKITLSLLNYYDEKLKTWTIDQIDAGVQNSISIEKELVNYFEEKNAKPTTFNGEDWNENINPISSMTAENGPYAVFIINRKVNNQLEPTYHIKELKDTFSKYVTQEEMNELKEDNELTFF